MPLLHRGFVTKFAILSACLLLRSPSIVVGQIVGGVWSPCAYVQRIPVASTSILRVSSKTRLYDSDLLFKSTEHLPRSIRWVPAHLPWARSWLRVCKLVWTPMARARRTSSMRALASFQLRARIERRNWFSKLAAQCCGYLKPRAFIMFKNILHVLVTCSFTRN